MELNPFFFSDLSNSNREILIWQILFVKFSRELQCGLQLYWENYRLLLSM